MARKFTFRMDQEGVDELRRQLEALGTKGQEAFRSIQNASPQLANALDKADESVDRARKRLEDLGRSGPRNLTVVGAAAQQVDGQLRVMAGRLGPLGDFLVRLGPLGIAAGAGMAAVAGGATLAAREFAEAERIGLRLDAVLKATGNTAGLTRQQIDDLADSLAGSTVFDDEAIKEAATTLATFRSVSGEAFGDAIRLATDMSAVFGTDLRSAVTTVGKALEDPVQGVTALRRVGIQLSAQQRELIGDFMDSGRIMEAQAVVIAELQQQLGGAAAGEAAGLWGATEQVRKKWHELLEEFGKTEAVMSTTKGALGFLEDTLDFGKDLVTGPSLEQQREHLLKKRQRLEVSAGGTADSPWFSMAKILTDEEYALEVARLDELIEREERRRVAAEMRAQAAAQAQQADAAAEAEAAAAAERQVELDKELAKLVAARKREAEQEVEAQTKAIKAARAAVEAQIAGLAEERQQLSLTDRERFIRNELLKAEAEIKKGLVRDGPAYLRQVREEARALFDAQKIADDRVQAEKDLAKAREEAVRNSERLAEDMRRPLVQAAEGVQDAFSDAFASILDGGVDSAEEFGDRLVTITKTAAAEIAAALVFQPVMSTERSTLADIGLSEGIAQ